MHTKRVRGCEPPGTGGALGRARCARFSFFWPLSVCLEAHVLYVQRETLRLLQTAPKMRDHGADHPRTLFFEKNRPGVFLRRAVSAGRAVFL